MLTKLVNGKEVILTEEEEKNTRAYWAMNDKYPDYVGHCGFDGLNPPLHDMVQCKKLYISLINDAIEKKIVSLNNLIEMAREDGDTATETKLMEQEKRLVPT